MRYAPVLLFTYKRVDTLKQTIAALQKNHLAQETDLFIFSDGAKKEEDIPSINRVREFINAISGFKKITIYVADENKGLANSIISGVTKIIKEFDKVIVLEDDLVTTPNFLIFMNNALNFYEKDERIFSIAGYSTVIKNSAEDVYFTFRASSWGWATWKDRWIDVPWEIKNYDSFKRSKDFKKQFNKMGSDLSKMLDDQMKGKINSWAIRWVYHQFVTQRFTVYPTISKVQNIGTGKSATHTRDAFNRFETILDSSGKEQFAFIKEPLLHKYYIKQFLKQSSITTRIKYKILNKLKF